MKQVFAASSWLQLVNLVAAMDSGLIDDAEERVLITCDNRVVNEVGPSFAGRPEAEPLLARFDRIVDYNAWVWPLHPAQWGPSVQQQPMLSRLARAAWGLEADHTQLYLESIQSHPGAALAMLLDDAELFIHSDGLMGYGPTRTHLGLSIRQRLCGFLSMDLVPGLTPLMFSELPAVTVRTVSADALRTVIQHVARSLPSAGDAADAADTAPEAAPAPAVDAPAAGTGSASPGRTGLVIGQYLSDINLLELDEEIDVYSDLVQRAIADGCSTILFKAHPAASSAVGSVLAQRTREAGIAFSEVASSLPLELALESWLPDAVYSCFSTGMVTAARLHGIPATTLGTDLALDRFTPFQNSNRIPVTICHYLYGPGNTDEYELQDLVNTVGYAMQPERCAHLRPQAESFLAQHLSRASVYFKRRRLTKLDLPGRLPVRAPSALRSARAAAARSLPAPVLDTLRPAVRRARTLTDRILTARPGGPSGGRA